MGDRYRFGKESWVVLDFDNKQIIEVEDSQEAAEEFALHLAAKQDRTFYVAHVYKKAEPEKQPSRLVGLN